MSMKKSLVAYFKKVFAIFVFSVTAFGFLTPSEKHFNEIYVEEKRSSPWSLGLNLYNLSTDVKAEFFSYKEAQYEERRKRVQMVCQELNAEKEILHESRTSTVCRQDEQNCLILIDKKDDLGYCRIPKVASSSWLMRFKMLQQNKSSISAGNFSSDWTLRNNHDLHYESLFWWAEESRSFSTQLSSVLSFVFFRHPFDRVASAYHDKMEKCARIGMRPYVDYAREITRRYRSDNNELTVFEKLSAIPTPSEFVRYVAESITTLDNMNEVNEHWRPQSSMCPMCSINFDVHARFEDLEEDTAYILMKSGHGQLEPELRVNAAGKKHTFWEGVSMDLREKLAMAYETDFRLTGYDWRDFRGA